MYFESDLVRVVGLQNNVSCHWSGRVLISCFDQPQRIVLVSHPSIIFPLSFLFFFFAYLGIFFSILKWVLWGDMNIWDLFFRYVFFHLNFWFIFFYYCFHSVWISNQTLFQMNCYTEENFPCVLIFMKEHRFVFCRVEGTVNVGIYNGCLAYTKPWTVVIDCGGSN